ncbi:MAG TPA: TetR/AcrR family transcriptional regulator [Actinomycetota bacterium]|nr:TetR/AcrR family transcriptional regulator [Actinomycetota bacterium]
MEILEAAADVIRERGLCETRIADVARRAGTSAALVLYYFESKDRLLTEALTHAEDRFYLQTFYELTGLESAADRLLHLIDRSLPGNAATDTLGDWQLWFELWSRALRDPDVARKREALDRRWRDTIAQIVRDGQEAGEFQPVDAEDFALTLACLIDGLAIQAIFRDRDATADRVREACIDVARRELGIGERRTGGRRRDVHSRAAGAEPAR